jgi:three-Cys-motif partner protein
VEAFAGPGRLYVDPRSTFIHGSPLRALDTRRRLDGYLFNDCDRRCYEVLGRRVGHEPNVHLTCSSANDAEFLDRFTSLIPTDALVVLYADPAGLDFNFETIAYLRERYPFMDLLVNFPVIQFVRAMRGEQKRVAKLGGTPDVTKASRVLDHPNPLELISQGSSWQWKRDIRAHFKSRLTDIGFRAFDAESVDMEKPAVPIYDLMIASGNELAVRYFEKATAKGHTGQYRMGGRT